jgi:Outer membrane lipoprotein-sorting protein
MKRVLLRVLLVVGLAQLCYVHLSLAAAPPTVTEIIGRLIDVDPWGFGGAIVDAHVKLIDKGGSARELSFSARSRRYDAPFSKSVVRFTAPADLAGAGFLQIQKRTGDDERYLFLPELKRSRRISGNLRGNSFMGTDFSFADLDRRDLRDSTAKRLPDETIGTFPCFRIDATPTRSDSPYSRLELWIRMDNSLPLKMNMYDASNALFKTFTAQEVRRVSGHWYVTKSKMVDHLHGHETQLVMDSVVFNDDIPDEEFTIRNLEKL